MNVSAPCKENYSCFFSRFIHSPLLDLKYFSKNTVDVYIKNPLVYVAKTFGAEFYDKCLKYN